MFISMRCARHTPPAHDAPEHDTHTVCAPVDPCEQAIDEEIDGLDDLDDLIQLDRELHVTDQVPPASDTIDPSSDTGPLRQQAKHGGGETMEEENTADEEADVDTGEQNQVEIRDPLEVDITRAAPGKKRRLATGVRWDPSPLKRMKIQLDDDRWREEARWREGIT